MNELGNEALAIVRRVAALMGDDGGIDCDRPLRAAVEAARRLFETADQAADDDCPREQFRRAVECNADTWVPACGGGELPFTYNGRRWLYCYNPAQRAHGYLDLETDMIHDDFRHPMA